MEHTYTSVIIRKRDVGETDRLYSLLTLERGKMQVLAKGVRKPQAKLAGLLENFTLADVTIARSRGTGKITGSIVENNFTNIKRDLDALENVFASINLINRFTDIEHEDPKLFSLVREYLESVESVVVSFGKKDEKEKRHRIKLVSVAFLAKAAMVLGYAIEVGCCAHCGDKLGAGDTNFDARSGGVACVSCARKSRGLVHITHNGIKGLRIFMKSSLSSLAKLRIEDRDVRSINGALTEFFRWIG